MIGITLYVPRSEAQFIRDKQMHDDFRISSEYAAYGHETRFTIVSTETELLSLILKYGSDNAWENI